MTIVTNFICTKFRGFDLDRMKSYQLYLYATEENLISARVTKTVELTAYYQYQASPYRYEGVRILAHRGQSF
jgi:hypothetical protein